MSIKQITDELDALDTQWDEFHANCEGMSGSPGEWMIERMDELETELRRRGSPVPPPQS
jgi:hypothetical protein